MIFTWTETWGNTDFDPQAEDAFVSVPVFLCLYIAVLVDFIYS